MKRRRPARAVTPGKKAETPLPLGKLPPRLLDRLLNEVVLDDPAVLQGPAVGLDAAVLANPKSDMLVVTSDPITFTASEAGQHLLAVNINDVVTTGACPRWLALTLLLPPGTNERQVEALFQSIGEACREHDIVLVGGHTEITDAVTRPVAAGTLLGTVKRDRKVDPSRAQPGDAILLMGPIAVEGTAILAREHRAKLEGELGSAFVDRCEALLRSPGICVREAALLAVSRYLAHALHDPTEGGLATALHELAAVTRCGVDVDAQAVSVLVETQTICAHLGVDPFGLLASGSLLVAMPRNEAQRLAEASQKLLGVQSTIIGSLTEGSERIWKNPAGEKATIPEFPRDELARVLESVAKAAPKKRPGPAPA